MDTDGFRAWLNQKDGLSVRAVGDVVSRLNRLAGLIDLPRVKDRADMDVALIKTPKFQAMSMSVKSQLRRAGQLWLDYSKAAQ